MEYVIFRAGAIRGWGGGGGGGAFTKNQDRTARVESGGRHGAKMGALEKSRGENNLERALDWREIPLYFLADY